MEKQKLKILQVCDSYFPNFDGPNQVATYYAKSLQKMGNELKLAVPFFPNYTDNQPFEVFRVKSTGTADGNRAAFPTFDRKLKKFLKQNKFDIIHIHSPFTMCRFFAKYGKKHKIPTIFTFHTKFRDEFERILKFKFLQKFMMRFIMKSINAVDFVLTVSDGAKDCLIDYGYKKDITVIRNGTDLTFPQNADSLLELVNQKYNLGKNQTVFLSVGRIVENKRLDLALNALKIVSDKGFDFRYLIVGAGAYEQNLKNLVSELGLDKKVIFCGKIMDRELLTAHYLRSSLFLFPSTFDTASLAPIEAAAAKLPTLLTEGCSTAEIVDNGKNGLLAKHDDASDWAQKIEMVLCDSKLASQLKQNCFNEVCKTWDCVAEEVNEFYLTAHEIFGGGGVLNDIRLFDCRFWSFWCRCSLRTSKAGQKVFGH